MTALAGRATGVEVAANLDVERALSPPGRSSAVSLLEILPGAVLVTADATAPSVGSVDTDGSGR